MRSSSPPVPFGIFEKLPRPNRFCSVVKEQWSVATTDSAFTAGYAKGQALQVPVAHHDGNYTIDAEGLKRLQDEDQIAFTYGQNPNGSMADIAGVLSANRRVLGMMPHPENMIEPLHGRTDCRPLFESLLAA